MAEKRQALYNHMKNSLAAGLVLPGEHVLCALSGGADSVALLHLLHGVKEEMGFSLSAAHYHHGLRRAADGDAAFVEELCKGLGVPLTIGYGKVAEEKGNRTLEEAARAHRYGFLEETMAAVGADKIAVAHHQRDQAETVLMHLIRGTGTRGLRGMDRMRGDIIRPLLDVDKAEITAFLQEEGIGYREDETNADKGYTRNRIRLELLPLLQEYNPRIEEALCRTARAVAEDEAYLVEEAEAVHKAFLTYHHPGYSVVWKAEIAALPLPIQKRVLRLGLEALGEWHLDGDMLKDMLSAVEESRRTDIGGGLFCDRKGDVVQLYRPFFTEEVADLEGAGGAVLESLLLRVETNGDEIAKRMGQNAQLRTRRPGDVVYLRGKVRPFAAYLKDTGLPRCIRDALGLVCVGSRVLVCQHLDPTLFLTQEERETLPGICFFGGVERGKKRP
ncbi:tRNA lysidine(34) synthetase TilS [Eubacteriales bacterium OttesenSCG-928-M02]|nr:tRNA lysidine(34) synthetase TilS [Eubacteriales bacterium OttesenSCG-928-M02]